MKRNNQYLDVILRWISDWSLMIGDVLFAVWVIQLITQFEAHPSYPFLGLRGWVTIFVMYLIGFVSSILRKRMFPSRK